MGRPGHAAVAGLLLLALSACTGGTPDASPTAAAPSVDGTPSAAGVEPSLVAPAGRAVDLETGTDAGNGRPESSHDGLMVRRRIVVAVHPSAGADLHTLRGRLVRAAAEDGIGLSDISPMVLDAPVLDHLVPELIAALPPGRTREEGEHLAERAFGKEGSAAGVEHVHVASVLVHDLQFKIASADPAALAAAIAAEGILSGALGNYEEQIGAGTLTIGYTGPLLSDALIESVRDGMARGAGGRKAEVELGPRSTAGQGVDLSKEPLPVETGADDSDRHPPGEDDGGH